MKRIITVFATLLCAFCVSGCVDQNIERSTDVTDRIVATSAAAVEVCNILELDLTGVPTTNTSLPERYNDKSITRVGSAMSPDTEIIASLKPTDIIGPDTLIDTLKPTYDALSLPYTFINLRSVSGLYESIEMLGEKYSKQDKASEVLHKYKQDLSELERRKTGKASPKVLVLMGFPGSYCQATDSSYIGNLVSMAGGENIVDDASDDFVNVNTESLISCDPDFILWTSHAMPDRVAQMFQKEFSENDVWKNFRAVRENRVIQLDDTLFSMSANFRWQEALEFLYDTFYGEE